MTRNISELIIYDLTNGDIKLDVNLKGETVWLSLEQMTRLFGRDKSVISRHIKNIFEEDELERNELLQNLQQPLNMVLLKEKHKLIW